MSADQTIDYEGLVQDAMRGLVRSVLQRVVKHGLPGEHHFYIAFDTNAPGVSISKRLMEKYPDEMTIVMQHRFWDLHVSSERFELKLTFDSIPERLVVPFSALKVFFDPSVPYGLQFEEPDPDVAHGDAASQVGDTSDENVAGRLSVVDDRISGQNRTLSHLRSMETQTPAKRTSRRKATPKVAPVDDGQLVPEELPTNSEHSSHPPAVNSGDNAGHEDMDAGDTRSPKTGVSPRKRTESVPAVASSARSTGGSSSAKPNENGRMTEDNDKVDISEIEAEEIEAGEIEAREIQGVADAKVVSLDAFRKK